VATSLLALTDPALRHGDGQKAINKFKKLPSRLPKSLQVVHPLEAKNAARGSNQDQKEKDVNKTSQSPPEPLQGGPWASPRSSTGTIARSPRSSTGTIASFSEESTPTSTKTSTSTALESSSPDATPEHCSSPPDTKGGNWVAEVPVLSSDELPVLSVLSSDELPILSGRSAKSIGDFVLSALSSRSISESGLTTPSSHGSRVVGKAPFEAPALLVDAAALLEDEEEREKSLRVEASTSEERNRNEMRELVGEKQKRDDGERNRNEMMELVGKGSPVSSCFAGNLTAYAEGSSDWALELDIRNNLEQGNGALFHDNRILIEENKALRYQIGRLQEAQDAAKSSHDVPIAVGSGVRSIAVEKSGADAVGHGEVQAGAGDLHTWKNLSKGPVHRETIHPSNRVGMSSPTVMGGHDEAQPQTSPVKIEDRHANVFVLLRACRHLRSHIRSIVDGPSLYACALLCPHFEPPGQVPHSNDHPKSHGINGCS
jgi:hypothetical protein